MSSLKTWADLTAQWETTPPERPSGLLLSEIVCRSELVSFRNADAYPVVKHADDLTQRLKRTGTPFDPLLVARVGDRWVLLDGYLRWAAYKAAGWRQAVPVRVFQGSASDALLAVIETNSQLKLTLTPEERSNAAWRLVRLGAHSKAIIGKVTGTGSTSVARMRKQLKALQDEGLDPESYSGWRDARRALEDRENSEPFDDDGFVKDTMERLVRALGPRLQQQTQLCAEALYEVAGHKARSLAEALADLTGLIDLEELGAAYREAFQYRSLRFLDAGDEEPDF